MTSRTQTSLHDGPPNLADGPDAIRPRDQTDVDAFINSLRGKSPKTATSYREGIMAFARFVAVQGMPPLEAVTREHVEAWLDTLYKKGNGPSTIYARQAALRAFFRWAVDVDLRADSPLARIRPPKLPVKVEATYGTQDIEGVLAAIPTKKAAGLLDLRDTALVLLLGDTGLRAAELCGLDTDDVDMRGQRLLVREGKGGKQRTVPFGASAGEALFRYLRRRNDGDRAPLFAGRSHQRLTPNSLRRALEARFKVAGVAFAGCHAFRRGWACGLLANGSTVLDLKELAGWNSLEMVYRYTRASATERALTAYVSPMDRLLEKGRRT